MKAKMRELASHAAPAKVRGQAADTASETQAADVRPCGHYCFHRPARRDSCGPWAQCKCRLCSRGSSPARAVGPFDCVDGGLSAAFFLPTTGVLSWSCVHSPLKLFTLVAKFYRSRKISPECGSTAVWAGRRLAHSHRPAAQFRIATEHTLERTPTPAKDRFSRMKTKSASNFPFIGSVRRRLGMADAEGLRGNEA